MTTQTILTVKALRDMLGQLGAGHDNSPVLIWKPGQYIALNNSLAVSGGFIRIEGNDVADDYNGAQRVARLLREKGEAVVDGKFAIGIDKRPAPLGATENVGSTTWKHPTTTLDDIDPIR